MKLESKYFPVYMNTPCNEIPQFNLKIMVLELITNAIWLMNTDLESTLIAKSAETLTRILKEEKYKWLPLHLVIEGFSRGSMGELGGTTKFSLRNVFTWLTAMDDKDKILKVEQKSREDAARRKSEETAFKGTRKSSSLYGSALWKKIEWITSGAVPKEAYDDIKLDRIVELIKQGHRINDIKPSML